MDVGDVDHVPGEKLGEISLVLIRPRAENVHVTNAMYGATLKVYVNNVQKGTGVFRDPHAGFVFTLGSALAVGQTVAVSQTVGLTTSLCHWC